MFRGVEVFGARGEGRGRLLTVSFLICASGKETDMATPLGLEKYGRIDFTLGRWVPTDPKTPKWI